MSERRTGAALSSKVYKVYSQTHPRGTLSKVRMERGAEFTTAFGIYVYIYIYIYMHIYTYIF